MEFKVSKEALLPSLQMMSGVVEKKQTLPILSHIYFHLENGLLSLTGSDLEIELNLSLMVEEITPGKVTISAQKIFDICKSLPDEAILHFKVSESKISLGSNKSKFSLSTLNTSEFPRMEKPEGILSFKIKQNIFLQLLHDTAFSMAQQDVRYYLNGMLFEMENNVLTVVATDGHRLASSSETVDTQFSEKKQIIVPRKAVMEIIKILDNNDDLIEVQISENQILLQNEEITLIIRLIDGRYPDYEKVIPKQGNKEIIVNKESIKNALQRAAILSNEKYRGIRMIFKDDTIHIYANNSDKEEAQDEIKINYSDEPLEIGFNVSYLLDAINAVESENIKIIAKDANDSCLVQNETEENPIYVVMPMRL